MSKNKFIDRTSDQSTVMYDRRSLKIDYRTLQPLLKTGMRVLDVGCATGSISRDIAHAVGSTGSVVAIDNTAMLIDKGKSLYGTIENLKFIHTDLFDYIAREKFDLIVSARVLQWLSNPKEALLKMKSLLNKKGQISILDYNHEKIEWSPKPPESMKEFYAIFLQWRKDAGMNNAIGDDLTSLFKEIGMTSVEKMN